jgi:nucleoside phosphorylase
VQHHRILSMTAIGMPALPSYCKLNLVGKDSEHSVDNVGTVPAALSTYLACQRFQPDLIISVGTAGGFQSQGAAIGDVFLGTTIVNHDRRIPIPVSH